MATKASAVISFRMVKLVAIAAFVTVALSTAASVFVKTQGPRYTTISDQHSDRYWAGVDRIRPSPPRR